MKKAMQEFSNRVLMRRSRHRIIFKRKLTLYTQSVEETSMTSISCSSGSRILCCNPESHSEVQNRIHFQLFLQKRFWRSIVYMLRFLLQVRQTWKSGDHLLLTCLFHQSGTIVECAPFLATFSSKTGAIWRCLHRHQIVSVTSTS